jgi:hypothetical protein
MNFTKQTLFALDDDWNDSYWLNRAVEEILVEWGFPSHHLDDVRFQTQDAAHDAAIQILQRLAALTPHCNYPTFDSNEGLVTATKQLGSRPIAAKPTTQGRFIGEPTFEILEGVSVEMVRPTEVRLVSPGKTVKTIVVDDETWTKEVPDDRESEWFKGDPDRIRLGISECTLMVAS